MSSENVLEKESQKATINATHQSESSGLWQNLKLALNGSNRDYTSGSLGKAIMLLSVPMVLEMLMESIFGVVDVFFVAKLGANAVTAVGLTESVIVLVFAIAIGLCMSTTAIIARRIGEKDQEGAAVAAVQAIAISIFISVPVALIGVYFAEDFLVLMGATPEVTEIGAGFTAILIGGNVTIMLLFLNNAIFRGAGDAALAMRALWLANSINIVLDPCFIFGLGPFPELGVTGAAVATTIGRGTGVLFQFYILLRGKSRIRILKRHLKIQLDVMLRLIRVSLGGILQFTIETASWIGLVRIIAMFGSIPVAGYTIGTRIILFTILPAWGFGNAAATLVGQNLGAKQPERAERAAWLTAHYTAIFMLLVAVLFISTGDFLMRLFTDDAGVIPIGVEYLLIISFGYVFFAYGMILVQSFNGAGDTVTPSIMNFFCFWLFRIPLAYFMAVTLGMEARGVFIAMTISESVLAPVAILIFRRGKWKLREI
jgi:putative MATE family efflux protein